MRLATVQLKPAIADVPVNLSASERPGRPSRARGGMDRAPGAFTGIWDSESRPIFSRPMVRLHGCWTPDSADRSPLTLDTMVGWLAL
ncbi:MAG: hypothetical protein M3065_14825 [Actinomycetota bacterium]|nr:hypothetical protein [Actinomycetota bacterium]